MCSVFVLVRIRGDAESLQDASDFFVSTLSVHLAPREAGISSPLARTNSKRESQSGSLLLLVRIRGDAELLQDASEFPVYALSVHLAPREARISCPLARTIYGFLFLVSCLAFVMAEQ